MRHSRDFSLYKDGVANAGLRSRLIFSFRQSGLLGSVRRATSFLSISSAILLPVLFAVTGLRTEIGLLASPELVFVCLGVIAIAIIGKLGGTALAARFCKKTWADSLALGVLMNTRGLMELSF